MAVHAAEVIMRAPVPLPVELHVLVLDVPAARKTVSSRDADGPAVHLLQLAGDGELGWGWGDAGTLYFTIPVKALADGDFGQAVAQVCCC
ncbi:DUF1963 domain-containing protein [Streptomyces collinus]|uniref:DUF1963 domain-containing protein n=1 Tax=Streptomyces collinus TaxID=42684 RepID=UPI002942AF78|nr:DUF1963 domain-containing protein [Streptomyces collinus]